MEKEIKCIEIGLENVEVITIDVKDIEYMCLDSISERDILPRYSKKIDAYNYCKSLRLIINKRADKKYQTYGGLSDLTVFGRLTKYNDIVDITYIDMNGNKEEPIHAPWKSKTPISDEENLYQYSRVDKDGNLEILIIGAKE